MNPDAIYSVKNLLPNEKRYWLWSENWDSQKQKKIKTPMAVENGRVYKSNPHSQPEFWLTVDQAYEKAKKHNLGIAIFISPPYALIDYDHCLINNWWRQEKIQTFGLFNGCYWEVSTSGDGAHHIVKHNLPSNFEHCVDRKFDNGSAISVYTNQRFCALTGISATGHCDFNSGENLKKLLTKFYPPKASTIEEWNNEPVEEWAGYEGDEELIEHALKSKSAKSIFGSGASFYDLWTNNTAVLQQAYDANQGYSVIDAALAQQLAFWTGNNHERIFSLMWRSGLVREKWNRPDYLYRTIKFACSQQKSFHQVPKKTESVNKESLLKIRGSDKQIQFANDIIEEFFNQCNEQQKQDFLVLRGPALDASFWINNRNLSLDQIFDFLKPIEIATNPLSFSSNAEIVQGFQFLGVPQQMDFFKGCVYVQDQHRIFTPNGVFLKQEQFNATYGGYVFQLDNSGTAKVTKKAWEAFTESQAIRWPIANSSCFRPQSESGKLVEEEGLVLVNQWVPLPIKRKPGDAGLFLEHLKKVLPDSRDRNILLSYMSACVQYAGQKFRWAPLIQGVPGNGKTLFTFCLIAAIGKRYSHIPAAEKISEKFNSWLFNTILIGVEDVFVPYQNRELLEILKPMITGEFLSNRAMHAEGVMKDCCCNFIFNCNDKSGLPKHENDRRIAPFYTAQQHVRDLTRDGLDSAYFSKLFNWLKFQDGYAIVTDFLYRYEIPEEFNPTTGCQRAPLTSSTADAIKASLGSVEQEILEAIEQNKPGFADGWVSSIALERLLHNLHASRSIPHNKRRDVLQNLGYDFHPALKEGRANNYVSFDAGKPRIYIRDGHIYGNLKNAAEVVKYYQEAQTKAATQINSAEANKVFR